MNIDTLPAAQAVDALIHDYGRLVIRVIYGLSQDTIPTEKACFPQEC